MWWLVAAAALGIAMVITTLPELGMLAIGGAAAAATSGLGGGVVLQTVVFLAVSVALVGVVRGIALRHRATPPRLRTGIDALKGRSALVVERVDQHAGRIKLAGEIWSARALDTGRVYEAGEEVDVVDIEGATAVVM
ncbi:MULTISPECIES: NfeD family protein [Streptomycetaceae]|uniref:Integral membrane protein n=1 Tax=Streptantibioticus cattleyicolor (strain ATCC 35852 / DSM 46488 / JCM 4925 / NBRC 14057 / NRRL 8057) TaxID=1003195 RepID=F8JXY0_STREN|nr:MULTISPECIES: NfeD family protein [Streptomycetaceae]AEW93361.1 integral membrane protein [Streptantibioticus cattleyicolor NRRL 8057 = DSM 46488]MYS58077.1 NfeD family protein [Streptomyces sp. SID5468]CCB73717.1 putative membrane protein [Streptantibioticus cattleyicolor NRRL 8057 = DSM 46488]